MVQNAWGAEFDVWVVPGASRTEIKGEHDGALKVRVRQPAARGRANRAVKELLETRLGCVVELVRGERGRRKTYRAPGSTAEEVLETLESQARE